MVMGQYAMLLFSVRVYAFYLLDTLPNMMRPTATDFAHDRSKLQWNNNLNLPYGLSVCVCVCVFVTQMWCEPRGVQWRNYVGSALRQTFPRRPHGIPKLKAYLAVPPGEPNLRY